ncbi:MAG: hypothetical protein JNJ50_27570 [Acidobacteria bacterium]|nr:hypothetical protein [Acidobacteriota bacterium]
MAISQTTGLMPLRVRAATFGVAARTHKWQFFQNPGSPKIKLKETLAQPSFCPLVCPPVRDSLVQLLAYYRQVLHCHILIQETLKHEILLSIVARFAFGRAG